MEEEIYDPELTISRMLRLQADHRGNAPALRFSDRCWTYRELDPPASRLQDQLFLKRAPPSSTA